MRITYTEDDVFGNQERDANAPPIDIALEKQLGLELAATNGPVPVYRIDRASRPLPK